MAIKLRTKRPDPHVKQIADALRAYEESHPDAGIEVYRQNSVSIRIRIIDSSFAGTSRAEREDAIWQALDQLPDEVVAEISVLLLLTPEEAKESFASMEFDHPLPSRL